MKELVWEKVAFHVTQVYPVRKQNSWKVGSISVCVCKQRESINLELGPKDRAACYRMLATPALSQGTVLAFK